jgi:hypothetical protein
MADKPYGPFFCECTEYVRVFTGYGGRYPYRKISLGNSKNSIESEEITLPYFTLYATVVGASLIALKA